MNFGLIRTPLFAAFFCIVSLAGCNPEKAGEKQESASCPAPDSPIANVQGDAPESPMLGRQVRLQGIVTLVQAGKGFFMEEPASDANERTSNAIFIQSTELPHGIAEGALASVQGYVAEIGGGRYPLTALQDTSEVILCGSNQPLPLTEVKLPLNGLDREALEAMRITSGGPLTVADAYQFGLGNITLSGNGLQFTPTEVMAPGPETLKMVTSNRSFALPVMLSGGMEYPAVLSAGTTVKSITGVLAHDGKVLRLSLQSIVADQPPDFTPPGKAAAGSLRLVGMNLHNYFNGDGNGNGFPTPRGAETLAEFNQQRDRIGAAIEVLDPHIIAVMELENDGFGAGSAAEDFIQLAESFTGERWDVTRPVADDTGDDQIAVGIFYRSGLLKAVGPAQTLTGPEFTRSRQPQAQLFEQLPNRETILVVVNHLKSKGSCPDSGENADQKDGQGCWNPMRLASAKKMSAWVKSLAVAAGTDSILVLGDMNAYRNEQPIVAIREAGFTELMDDRQGETYSSAFYGQHGTLDYAFASKALLESVQQAFIWHVNADLPVNIELPLPWLGFSDHDPVVVDLRSRQ